MKINRSVPSTRPGKYPHKEQKSAKGRAAPAPKEANPNDSVGRSLLAQTQGNMPYGIAMEKRLAAKRRMTRT